MNNSKLSVYVVPQHDNLPRRGGVREHLIQLYRCLGSNPRVKLAWSELDADVVHVESSYKAQRRKPDLYVCHGGFVPDPIPSVISNLNARVIVSVAQWIADQYFPQFKHKTVVIPNGVDLSEWRSVPGSGIKPGYILYAKEWLYHMDDFIWLAEQMPKQRFVSTVWPEGMAVLSNVEVIGLQSREVIRSVLKDAAFLVLPGPEVCPTMLLEAWAAGTPVLSTIHGGAVELMARGDGKFLCGGMLYTNREVMRLCAMNMLDQSEELGAEGRERVETCYQWKNLFHKYVRLYEAIRFNELEEVFQEAQRPAEVVG